MIFDVIKGREIREIMQVWVALWLLLPKRLGILKAQ